MSVDLEEVCGLATLSILSWSMSLEYEDACSLFFATYGELDDTTT